MPTEVIADHLSEFGVPPAIRKDGVLVVERRWVARDLPEHELLDVLAQCYGVLGTLVVDAHRRCGFQMRTFRKESHEERPVRTEHLEGKLPCMVATAADRSIRIHLPTGGTLTAMQIFVPADPSKKEDSLKRYGASEGDLARRPGEDLLAASDRWFEHAKRVLAKDGYHHTLINLYMDDGGSELHFLDVPDRAGFYVLMRQIADQVERLGATGLLHIAEFWAADPRDLRPGQSPSEIPNRKEALQVTAATADGRTRIHSVEFRKNDQGEIEFGASDVSDVDETPGGGFLAPVRAVWRRWADRQREERKS